MRMGHSSLEADGYRRDMEQVSLGMDLCTSVLSSMQMWRKHGRTALKDSSRNIGKRLHFWFKRHKHLKPVVVIQPTLCPFAAKRHQHSGMLPKIYREHLHKGLHD